MENIITDTRQLEKDNQMMKTELDNRMEDLAKQTKSSGDNKVIFLEYAVGKRVLLYHTSTVCPLASRF